jgi:hypothetical protein
VDDARTTERVAEDDGRRPYVAPRLEVYGDLARLTQTSKGGSSNESGPNTKISYSG